MAVSKVIYGGNTLVDLTGDTVSAATLTSGTTAHAANGALLTGTYSAPVSSVNGKTGAVTLTASDVGAASFTGYTGTLLASGWSASAPYTQTLTISGLTTGDHGSVDADLSSATTAAGIAILEAWGFVSRVYVSAANKLTAICYEDKPTVNIPIKLEVLR